ncbi:hypothetical protein CA13_68590 [Planctomycetes bacterium CA13]|uniref:Uncharacterized protein n=1 Tax=Novipirellula herctigrandis TaxID=2527986 RepID=A0A5C5YNB5_9BACT|nr:hypothetical protein CA13_68590 [Planctomycetes bacterium CA13]
MKIRSIKKRFGSTAVRTLAACGLLAGSLVASNAHAQSGLVNAFETPAKATNVQQTAASNSRSIKHGDQEFAVMTAEGVPTAASAGRVATLGSMPTSELNGGVTQTSCLSCGTSCGGSCPGGSYGGMYGGSCNTGSCGNYGGYGSSMGGGCGIPCRPYRFAMVEALYMEHQGDAPQLLGSNFQSAEFDFEWGSRITVGMVPDCVHGMETTFVGPFNWDLQSSSTFTPPLAFDTVSSDRLLGPFMAPFTDVVADRATYEADYWSIEANKTLVGWDVAKLLIGGRYIDYDELYRYGFSNDTGEQAVLQSETENSLYGMQVGLDMLFPTSCHGYMDFRGRAGGYLNFAESDVRGFNTAGATVFANDDDLELAGVFELGAGYRYELGEMLTLRAGGEMWYVTGIADAPTQLSNVVRRGSGQSIAIDDDFFVIGVNFGAQMKF